MHLKVYVRVSGYVPCVYEIKRVCNVCVRE